MSVNDPIGDMLTRIRNALMARHETVMMPSSKLKVEIARVLKEQGLIRDYEVVRGHPSPVLRIHLAYKDPRRREPVIRGLKRVSKPGLRVYVGKDRIPRPYGRLGVVILSTSQGVMTGQEARQRGIGGEVLCMVW